MNKKAASTSVPSPFVVLPEDLKDKIKEEKPDENALEGFGPPLSLPKGQLILVHRPNNNNGNTIADDVAHKIKEEPLDEDVTDGPSTAQVVSLNDAITIKTEARFLEEPHESKPEDDEGEEGDEGDSIFDSDEDFEDDFQDDSDDSDFEMDLSEDADSPDGMGPRPHPQTGISSKASSVLDLNLVKEEIDEGDIDIEDHSIDGEASNSDSDTTEGGRPKRGSFDFNGMKIETNGNYSKCPTCKKNIKSTFIIRHIKLHNQPEEQYKCPEKKCNLMVNRINNLFRHLKVVHKSKKPYLCKDRNCTERFAKASELRTHFMKHREERRKTEIDQDGPNRIFACEFPGCGKEYKKRHHLKEHERKHTGDMKYSCEVCGKRFYIQAHMKRHLYSHTGIKPHVCRWKCGAIFASYGGRMKHERINHYDENPLRSECDICGRPFKNQQQLVKHRMTHLNPEERKDYRCSYCHIMFDTIKLRERHEERHKDGEVFSCETCEKVFKNEKNLNHHVKTHHMKKSDKPTTPNAKKGKKEPPPKHPCHICGPPKMYCLTSLRRHLARIHSTNYKCPRDDCGKCFKEKFQLEAHVEIHRLRECHLCGKKFQRKQNADIHLLGVHALSVGDLSKLGRWNPKNEGETAPEYMTRKTNVSFKNFRKKGKGSGKRDEDPEGTSASEQGDESNLTGEDTNSVKDMADETNSSSSNDFIAIEDIKDEPI
eukprot:snap_masked-scaffold355_size198070-processed-gene-0.17 protein:Tk03311 transcript:snap_masked-scaffold355_size198070-processed-gene-0.17-mRNA-1 annotation:"zinc finger and scan domain-containing protein 2"